MNRLLIIDGSNLLFQMFFGMPVRIVNEKGKPIQGTLGFVGALLKIIRKTEPTYVVVIFDGEYENIRSALDADYKANRVDYSAVPEEENPFSQLPDVYEALNYLGIKHTETVTCEADEKETEMIISSFDSDFFQLITDKVSVLRYREDKTIICTPEYIEEKYGIFPSQYADFKSLTGDTADNIKGADRIGPKTAAFLLNEFGSLDNILANAEKIEKPFIKDSVIRNAERLKRNYRLIKLGSKAPLSFVLHELKYSYNGITTNEVLKEIKLR